MPSETNFDVDMMLLAARIPMWPSPDVLAKVGAKDALCNIKHMEFWLPDTLGTASHISC